MLRSKLVLTCRFDPLLLPCVACFQLWDVCEDQDAVDLIRDVKDPQEASRVLLDHALQVSLVGKHLQTGAEEEKIRSRLRSGLARRDSGFG